MKQEEKELLLKDLCARLSYNVKCKVHLDTKGYCLRDEDKYRDDTLESVNYKKQTCTFNKSVGYNFGYFALEEVKPYLRPLSSMTEEESKEYRMFIDYSYNDFTSESTPCVYVNQIEHYIKWLNSHHFDWRIDVEGKSMIEKGLALEAPERMYK